MPKRKAPPPPSPGKEKCTSRHLSLEGTPTSIIIDKFKYPPAPTVQDKGSEIIKNNPSVFIRGSVELQTAVINYYNSKFSFYDSLHYIVLC